jgi:hypothetical protein
MICRSAPTPPAPLNELTMSSPHVYEGSPKTSGLTLYLREELEGREDGDFALLSSSADVQLQFERHGYPPPMHGAIRPRVASIAPTQSMVWFTSHSPLQKKGKR